MADNQIPVVPKANAPSGLDVAFPIVHPTGSSVLSAAGFRATPKEEEEEAQRLRGR